MDASVAAETASATHRLGVVVIGRNEGDRLERCLLSVSGQGRVVVYVDSGSTDGSQAMAASLGAVVCALDMARPFTAARARNEGLHCLRTIAPELDMVQFVDGDCEVAPGWLDSAVAFLNKRLDVVAVCGRRRERCPEASVYNRLCDMEWDTPIGLAKACGGDVLIRTAALRAVAGFRDDLIAGEEPELCIRLREKGGLIWRLDAEMTFHDASMHRFGQWWKRSMRAGYAYAEGARLHGAPPECHWVRESRSALAWGLWLPLVLGIASLWLNNMSWLGFLLYPLQVLRLSIKSPGDPRSSLVRSFFLTLGKFPEAAGQIKFFVNRLAGTPSRLIEYK